jgi:hypothetical protein
LIKSADVLLMVHDGQSTKLDGAHSPPKPLDPTNGRSVNANESVHYHHCSNGYSCHGRVEPVTVSDSGVTSANANESVHYNHFNHGEVATVVLNGLFVLHHGFMYSRSSLSRLLSGSRLPWLHTSSYQCIKRKYGIVRTGARRRNCASNKICLWR